MQVTRRELGKIALSTLPAALAWPSSPVAAAAQAKPNSKWNGVQVGLNVPYNFGQGNYMPGEEILRRTVQLGASAVELRLQPVELFMGSPAIVAAAGRSGRGAAPNAVEARTWRLAAPMSKAAEFKKMYADAGVAIEIVKVDGIFGFTDDEVEYAYTVAKALGARALSTEITQNLAETKRLGDFAVRHGMMIGYHGHTATGPEEWKQTFDLSKGNAANLDIGHFVGGHKTSPMPFLREFHARITHIHVKDKTLDDKNVAFGRGDTPIAEALGAIRDGKWNVQATIEFEYPGPVGADGRARAWTLDERMAEMATCMDFCEKAIG